MSSTTVAISSAEPGATSPALRWLHRASVTIFAAAGGAALGAGAWWIAAIAALPMVVLLASTRPEVVIVLFVTAGLYKQIPGIGDKLPFDLTIVLGALLGLTVLIRAGKLKMPVHSLLLLPLFAATAWGLVSPANAYGADKAMRFCTLTALVTIASVAIIDSPRHLQRLLVALAVLGFVVSVDALRHQDTGQWGRLSLAGSNPIPLGRIGAIAFGFAWIRFHCAKSRFERIGMIPVLGFAAMCTIASGSRGPVLSTLASLVLISVVTYSAHRRTPIALGPLLACAGLALAFGELLSGPSIPIHRFQLLLSEDKGTSILVRGYMFALAWKLTLANPFGIGVGGFEAYAPLELRYPHNLFLEVGSELGWIPLLSLVAFLAASLWAMVRVLRREYAWHTLFLALVVSSALMNAMVSGDLNDNRLLFATFLLPFTYARMQRAGEGWM